MSERASRGTLEELVKKVAKRIGMTGVLDEAIDEKTGIYKVPYLHIHHSKGSEIYFLDVGIAGSSGSSHFAPSGMKASQLYWYLYGMLDLLEMYGAKVDKEKIRKKYTERSK